MYSLFAEGNHRQLFRMNSITPGFYFLLLTIINSSIRAFNIDTTNVKILKGAQGSHFGYSLAFDKSKKSLLVGAPRAVESIMGYNITSGGLHSCPLASPGCEDTSYNFPSFFSSSKSVKGENYGLSVSVSDSGKVTVCAPSWKDTTYEIKNYYFMPGRCVMKDSNGQILDIKPYYHTEKTARDFYIQQGEYFHGFALFGMSSDSYGESTFAYGAPGATVFEGGFYVKDYARNKATNSVHKEFRHTLDIKTAYGYLGYQVKFGNFFSTDIYLAVGGPNRFIKGMVRIHRWGEYRYLYDLQDLSGEQDWSYFGAVLCAVDTDQDRLDELLVGAPYYSDDDNHLLDQGKVYVYKNNEQSDTEEFVQQMTLHGNRNRYARFGSAIQSIGDINLDGYQDVAIGAPGEEDNTGCIYIYLGSPRGLVSVYSQRICANQIQDSQGVSLKWFGSTISKTLTQANSPYPSFAVSSFATDTVVLFNTRVIVRANATIQATPTSIDLNQVCDFDPSAEPCTTLEVCYQQSMEKVRTRELDFIVRIEVDAQRKQGVEQRVQFRNQAGQMVNSLGDLKISVDETVECHKYKLIVDQNQITQDQFTPIEIEVTMEIDSSSSSGGPILDPSLPNTFTHLVSLGNDCGSDNICHVDLSVEGAISYSHEEGWPYVVIDWTKEINVDVTIRNVKETSYASVVTLQLSQAIPYLRVVSNTLKQCKLESSDSGVYTNTVVICHYYQPMKQDTAIDASFVFDATKVALDQRRIKAIVKAAPVESVYSREKNPRDNTKEMSTRVYIVADVNLFGSSSPAEVTLQNAKKLSLTAQEPITKPFTQDRSNFETIVLNHKYQMKNLGPSRLPKTNIYLSIPAYLPDATQLVSVVSVQLQLGDEPAIICVDIVKIIDKGIDYFSTTSAPLTTEGSDGSGTTGDGGSGSRETTTIWSPSGGSNKRRRRRSADGDDQHKHDYSKMYSLTCDTNPEYCVIFKCKIDSDTHSGSHVSLNVTLDLDKGNIPVPEGFSSFYFQLQSLVQQPKHILFKPWNSESRKTTSARTGTMFHLVNSGEEFEIWIIIVSVIAGIVFILIIAVICWKVGFFKRKKHPEMEEWKRKSVRMSKAPEKNYDETDI